MDVSLLNKLMGPCYQLQAIDVAEIIGDFGSEHPAGSSRIDSPILNIFRIRPHQITERALMRDLNLSVDGSHLIDRFDLWTQPSMDAEDFP